ncbi:MAG: YkgJ family cysteine cluster protein [Pirellulales bacterium]
MSLPALPRRPLSRADHPADAPLCDFCYAKCCRYFALPIDTPSKPQDYDYLRWYLLHQQASLFVDEKTWYLLVQTPCKHLQPDHRCGIYETRPQICREYSTKDCEFDDAWLYEQYFETPEQLEEYVEAITPRPAGQSIRSPRPPVLPILTGAAR